MGVENRESCRRCGELVFGMGNSRSGVGILFLVWGINHWSGAPCFGAGNYYWSGAFVCGVGNCNWSGNSLFDVGNSIRSGAYSVVSQRASTGELNPRPRHIPATDLPLDYFLEHSGVGRLFPLMTPWGLTEHHQSGLPAPYCRARKGRPRRIPATTLTTEPPDSLSEIQ